MHAGEEFISEAITPDANSADIAAMSIGEPGLPAGFTWRGRHFVVKAKTASWKSSNRDRGELYLRRHWFEVVTECNQKMTLYCERQTKNLKKPKARWWLYKIEPIAPAV